MKELITAIITPMLDNYDIDYSSLGKIIEQQIEAKVTGIVILGSTGEGGSINNAEKLSIINFAIKLINKRIKLIVGLNYQNTNDYLGFLTDINQINAIDAILVSIPSYIKPSQSGIYIHFELIASKSKHDIIIYDVPSRTITGISDDVIINLANSNYTNIVAIKDATGNIGRLTTLKSKCPQQFKFYSGDDFTAIEFIINGGEGVISVASNVVASELINIINDINVSNYLAISKNTELIPFYKLLFMESNPIPIKWIMYKKGIIQSPILKLPLTPLSANLHKHYTFLF